MAIEEASREIMWNVSAPINTIVMYGLFGISLVIAAIGLVRRIELYSTGKADPSRPITALSLQESLLRFSDLFKTGLVQSKVVRDWLPAVAHTLIYIGFLVLLFTTTMVLIHHDLGIEIYKGRFYLAVTVLSDLFGLGLLIGCGLFAHRRWITRADLVHNRFADSMALIVLAVLCIQGFLLEGLRIHATNDPWAWYSPVGLAVAKLSWGLSPTATTALHFFIWWFHAITVFAAMALLPYSKFFHIIASSANLFFERSLRPRGRAPSPGDIEKLMAESDEVNFGLGTIADYSWKQLLDLDACTSCGRCQNACPAYNSGKPLSPKWLILDTRNHMLGLQANGKLNQKSILPPPSKGIDSLLTGDFYLRSSGLEGDSSLEYADGGSFRSRNTAVNSATSNIAGSVEQLISGELMDPNVFWSCTTCMACVEVCPVGINHVDQIIGNRQNMVLMRGEVPHEAQSTLKALENRANPFGAPEDRIKWIGDLDVPILKPGDSVDYLYWVGCVSAYDPRKQKIAVALAKIMKAAKLSFGILGVAEGCSGDPARRLGEENLFQTLAKNNIALLQSISFKTLVANCPHCFNTIKNEYPEFGNLGPGRSPEIIHHSVLLKRLLAENSLPLHDGALSDVTFHDPCYLGRANGEYDAPRQTLSAIKSLNIIEMEPSREKGMCCGAGGGHFWMDLKIGERINVKRTDQAAATGASTVATGCPFCLQMMEDGVKLTNRDESMAVRDLAEIIAERL